MKNTVKPKLESVTYTINSNKIKLYVVYNKTVKIHEFDNASALTKKELENNIKTLAITLNYEPISEQLLNVCFDYLSKLKKAHKDLKAYKFYIVNLDYANTPIKLTNPLQRNSRELKHSSVFGYPFKSFKTAQNSLDLALKRFSLYGSIETVIKLKRY